MNEQPTEPITKETIVVHTILPKRESGAQKKNRLRVASPPPPLAEEAPVKRERPKKAA